MSSTRPTIKIGGGLAGPLFVVFLVLKLTNQIDWSWLWVTSPLWLPFAIVLGIFAIVLLFMALMAGLAMLLAR